MELDKLELGARVEQNLYEENNGPYWSRAYCIWYRYEHNGGHHTMKDF